MKYDRAQFVVPGTLYLLQMHRYFVILIWSVE